MGLVIEQFLVSFLGGGFFGGHRAALDERSIGPEQSFEVFLRNVIQNGASDMLALWPASGDSGVPALRSAGGACGSGGALRGSRCLGRHSVEEKAPGWDGSGRAAWWISSKNGSLCIRWFNIGDSWIFPLGVLARLLHFGEAEVLGTQNRWFPGELLPS